MTSPADIGNRALRAAGSSWRIGSLEDGSDEANTLLEMYVPARQQLLRAAHWNMARKQAPMALLGDATGQTPNVGNQVIQPWTYEYQWPVDALKARFVPWNTDLQNQTQTPIMTGLGLPPQNCIRLIPARFLVGLDFNYPVPGMNAPTWDQQPDITDVIGVGPQQRTVVLTNVQNAQLIYTADIEYPDEWDPLFQEALVQLIASRIALGVNRDKNFGMKMTELASGSARGMITQARAADGNEGWTTTDNYPDWLRIRNYGSGSWAQGYGGPWGFAGGPGVLGYGWDSISLGNGSAF